jgi:hypothetical protein
VADFDGKGGVFGMRASGPDLVRLSIKKPHPVAWLASPPCKFPALAVLIRTARRYFGVVLQLPAFIVLCPAGIATCVNYWFIGL